MSKIFVAVVGLMIPGLVFAAGEKVIKRTPSSEAVKTVICKTGDMSPNIDIRIEFDMKKTTAIVKLIDFGNDVSQAPTEGWAVEVNLVDARDVMKGNAALAFYNKKALSKMGKVLALKEGNGYVVLPTANSAEIHKISDCRVD